VSPTTPTAQSKQSFFASFCSQKEAFPVPTEGPDKAFILSMNALFRVGAARDRAALSTP
jgi:hypothetical protein